VKTDVRAAGFEVIRTTPSPILGAKGNTEVLAQLHPLNASSSGGI
jgi:hypothetical protein